MERTVTVNYGREEEVDGHTYVYCGNTIYKYGDETLSVSDMCQQTLPCSHSVTINGSNELWSGVKINAWLTKRGFVIEDHIKKYTAEWAVTHGYEGHHELPPVDEDMPKTFKEFLEGYKEGMGAELTYAFNASDSYTRKWLKNINTKSTMIKARSKTECLLKFLTICTDKYRENFEARYKLVLDKYRVYKSERTARVMEQIVDQTMLQLFTPVELKFV